MVPPVDESFATLVIFRAGDAVRKRRIGRERGI
jgi:hypothetical protein